MRYLTSMQTAEKWGMTKRRVNSLCQAGSIAGAYKDGYRWMIPEDAENPGCRSGKREGAKVGNGKKPLPIGISDYRMAVSEYYYVDKTLLIKELLDYHPLVSLFTRPRRFGKTLNMDMLRVFFEKTEEDTSKYFRETRIWKAGNKYRREQGCYPVIFLTFKDVKYQSWDETRINLCAVIQAEYRRHIYLMESDRIERIDRKYVEKVLEGTLDTALWAGTLEKLSLLLELHHGTAPMILIDEYDIPIQQGYMQGFYEEVITFMRNFLSGGLKDNRHMSMAFMTGILRVAKESIFSGLNNLSINSVLEKRYSDYFGFTESDVKQILSDYGKPEKLMEIKEWYDGYRFGDSHIYNPWSVLNYVDSDFFPKTFWQSTGSNEIIGEIVKEASGDVLGDLQSLLHGDSVEAYVDTSVVYPEIRKNASGIYSFLLMAGYVTIRSERLLHDGNSICSLCIPNREIKILYEKEILTKLDSVLPSSAAVMMQQDLIRGDIDGFQKELQKFIMSAVSFYDTSAESFYHGLLLGISAVMNRYYDLASNREAGEGRYDIRLKPKNKRLPGFLIEIKSLAAKQAGQEDLDGALEELAHKGLRQIEKKHYFSELQQEQCSRIICMGVAFCGKQCRIASQKL